MKLPVSWLREFVDVPADPPEVARRLAACGFAVESIEGDVIDFEVTANRPDCLSVYGLAREASVAFTLPLAARPGAATLPDGATPVPVVLDDAGCGRYALALADVRVAASPEWLAARLTAAGVRPINNIVDVTNYVMLELGQPMHAFDAGKLKGTEIRVRRARQGERLTTLDGESRGLDPSMLVIADREDAVAIAGVMGGAGSEVSGGTTRIAIESAWFVPGSVRATSRRLGLKTEASARFERGADIGIPVVALQRAMELLVTIGAGRPASGVLDVYPQPAAPRTVPIRGSRVHRLLGDQIPDDDTRRILGGLGFSLVAAADGFQVGVPSFRVDVAREADLIEEVGRHWGFDRIPAALPPLTEAPPAPEPAAVLDTRLRKLARSSGAQEAVTFTFIERSAAEPFVRPGDQLVAIANPLSEKFAVLRPSLLPGLLDSLVYNRRRESPDVRLFEVGLIFHPAGERTRIGWVLTGQRADHWSGNSGAVDLFDAKGLAELLLDGAGIGGDALTSVPDDGVPWFVRGRSGRIELRQGSETIEIGWFGQLRADVVAARGLDGGVVVGGEIDLTALNAIALDATESPIRTIPRYPSVVRDLSLIVPERLPAADVRVTIRSNAPSTLAVIGEFDRYRGTGVPEGHISLSVRLTFRDTDRTLTDSEVQQAVDEIVQSLARTHGAVLRSK